MSKIHIAIRCIITISSLNYYIEQIYEMDLLSPKRVERERERESRKENVDSKINLKKFMCEPKRHLCILTNDLTIS